MKIWLDDIRPGPMFWEWCKGKNDVENAINICKKNNEKIEVMSFDHDLGLNEPNGLEILKWLFDKKSDFYPLIVKCHSLNPVGKENIKKFNEAVRQYYPNIGS